ncbi:MAG: hypothetical protein PHH54_07300 [Candidatus Nanoarchaeia archaeon]|nr:hypothetical protein [Candidatus Nanoarchaeia archaeon]MDD5741761.1 hypothetical protein [Candidatus Nanoarchaeia archaeon]
MYLILKKGVLREIVSKAFKKAGNIRKLEISIKIPRSTLSNYHNEKIAIKKENLDKLLGYLKLLIKEEDVLEKLPDNWKQIKGGKRCVETKKKNGTFEKQIREMRSKNSYDSERLRLWHKKMKKENIEKYHIMQYERFKKVGGYKFTTINGEKVRNELEKETADLLKSLKINYKYEPLVKADGKYFFPDFLIDNNIIIECTEWRGFDKAIKLKDKIAHLKSDYKVFVLVPKPLKRYYEILNQYLLLGIDDLRKTLKSL